MEKTALQQHIEFLDGMLKIEDGLIVKYANNPNAVAEIKDHWQTINMIKSNAKRLLPVERDAIVEAFNDGDSNFKIKFTGKEYYETRYGSSLK